MSSPEQAYAHGFATKCAQRGVDGGVGAAVGGVAGGAAGLGIGTVVGGITGGINTALAARLMFRNPKLKILAAALGGIGGGAVGGTVGGIANGIEGMSSGAMIGRRRGIDAASGVPRPLARPDLMKALSGNAWASTFGIGNVPDYVEERTHSIPRTLLASQLNEASNIAVAPVLGAKGVLGKRLKWRYALPAALAAKILTGTAATMALAHMPKSKEHPNG